MASTVAFSGKLPVLTSLGGQHTVSSSQSLGTKLWIEFGLRPKALNALPMPKCLTLILKSYCPVVEDDDDRATS
jgi:hypothetical protein